jgi:hypothetical protein
MSFRLALHKPDSGENYISGPGLRVRLIETFCIEPVVPQPPQVLGPEAAGRPENSQRMVFSLILISILAGSQALACLLQVYQYDDQDSPPVFSLLSSNQYTALLSSARTCERNLSVSCGNQMVWGIPERLMKE